jgi:hypothetical protein
MRKFLVAATLISMTMLPAAARAGFLVEASVGKGYEAAPKPRAWEQMNLEIAPGYAPSLPVLSMFRLQLGIVMDLADKSASRTNMELRPMISLVPPIFPLYGRIIFGVNNLFERNGSKREVLYGGAVGLKIGLPGIAFVPALGVFAEVGLLPRSRTFGGVSATTTTATTDSKMAWIVEGRAGAYINF